MKQNTFKILFVAKKARMLKNGEAPIYLRITINGKREEITTSQSVPLNKWNSQKGCVKGTGRKENEINQYLDAVQSKIIQIRRQLEIDGEVITARLIMGYIQVPLIHKNLSLKYSADKTKSSENLWQWKKSQKEQRSVTRGQLLICKSI